MVTAMAMAMLTGMGMGTGLSRRRQCPRKRRPGWEGRSTRTGHKAHRAQRQQADAGTLYGGRGCKPYKTRRACAVCALCSVAASWGLHKGQAAGLLPRKLPPTALPAECPHDPIRWPPTTTAHAHLLILQRGRGGGRGCIRSGVSEGGHAQLGNRETGAKLAWDPPFCPVCCSAGSEQTKREPQPRRRKSV